MITKKMDKYSYKGTDTMYLLLEHISVRAHINR